MLKFLVILCLSHLGDPAFRDRERWMSLLTCINNVFDCRKIILVEHFNYDLENRWRAEKVIQEYSNIKSMMPQKRMPRIVDFGISKQDPKWQKCLETSRFLYDKKSVTVINEPLRDAVQYYLQDKISEGATRGEIYAIIKRAERKSADRDRFWELFIED